MHVRSRIYTKLTCKKVLLQLSLLSLSVRVILLPEHVSNFEALRKAWSILAGPRLEWTSESQGKKRHYSPHCMLVHQRQISKRMLPYMTPAKLS